MVTIQAVESGLAPFQQQGPGADSSLEREPPVEEESTAKVWIAYLDQSTLDDELIVHREPALGPLNEGIWPCGEGGLRGNPVAFYENS